MRSTLGDIFEIGSGGTPSKTHPEYYDGDIPWVKTGDLKEEYLYSVEDCITEEGLNNSSAKMYQAGTVLIAMYGATIGATSILKFDACTNQACAAFKPCKDVLPEYLYYFLKSKKQKFISDGVGGAQPNISAGYLKKVSIDIRTIDEQEKIVTILDKLTRIIQNRQNEIDELDNLIKARFVELFDINNCDKVPLGDCTDFVDYRGHTPELSDNGTIRMINAKSVGKGFFKYVDEYVTEETYDNWMHRGFGYPGDILFVTEGHTFGNVCLIPENLTKFALGQRVITIKGHEEMKNAFLCSYMQTDMFWKDIQAERLREYGAKI